MISKDIAIEKDLWTHLAETNKKLVLYGTGDGADKIINQLQRIGKQADDFMASDDFVRGQSFRGIKVKTLDEIKSIYDDFIILVCFGTGVPEVLSYIDFLDSEHELYLPHVPVIGEGVFDKSYFDENIEKLDLVYDMLADELSKQVFISLINYRLSGKLKHLKNAICDRNEMYSLLNLNLNETYVDLGAYNGDTIEEFLHITGMHYEKIYAVEPDIRNYVKMRRRLYKIDGLNFEAHNAGIWVEEGVLKFNGKKGRGSAFTDSNANAKEIKAISVDSMLKGGKATYIKYDIEGFEAAALNGTVKTIEQYKPKLCVAAYHRVEDLFDLPILVKSLNKNYRIFIRHDNCVPDWDTNFYFV